MRRPGTARELGRCGHVAVDMEERLGQGLGHGPGK
jgi:hypothetical protein